MGSGIWSAAFGCRVESVFAAFDRTPLASASIGQAHAATLVDGSEVVVKVRRPGVVAQVDEDLELLDTMAGRAARRSETTRHYDVAGLASEFGATLRQELDYLREGRNAERFAANFAGDVSIHIPRVCWEATTSQVLTLERLRGVKASEPAALDSTGLDRSAVARSAAVITLRMVFEHGFFHADPHPGNFFVEPDGTIGLIDFGMVGSLDAATRGRLAALLGGFASSNGDVLLDNVLALGVATSAVDRDNLRADLLALAEDQLARPLGDVVFGTLLGGMLSVVRRHRLVLPTDLALVVKTIAMSEGVGAQIDPSFQLDLSSRRAALDLGHPVRMKFRRLVVSVGRADVDAGDSHRDFGSGGPVQQGREVRQRADRGILAGVFDEVDRGLDLGPHRAGGEVEVGQGIRACCRDGARVGSSPVEVDSVGVGSEH